MKKIIRISVLASLCLFLRLLSVQAQALSGGLKAGDKMPDITIGNILNYKTGSAKLSDFKGKLLILDFWATWCGGCIESFPKLDSLQKKYGERVQILAVTYEDREKVLGFFKKRAFSHPDERIVTAVNDTVLTKLYPHRLLPHVVWISPNGVVTAITSGEDVTAGNIQAILDKGSPVLSVKTDLDKTRPLFMEAGIGPDSILSYSILAKGRYPGLGTGSILRKTGNIIRGRAMTNASLYSLYQCAAIGIFERMGLPYSEKRMRVEISDSLKVRQLKAFDNTSEQYNFEQIVPLADAAMLYDRMLESLNRSTFLEGTIESQTLTCLILRLSDPGLLQTGGGKLVNVLNGKTGGKLVNGSMKHLTLRLNGLKEFPYPVIDETGYTRNFDLELPPFNSLELLRSGLKRYGLSLEIAERPFWVMVIKADSRSGGPKASTQINMNRIKN